MPPEKLPAVGLGAVLKKVMVQQKLRYQALSQPYKLLVKFARVAEHRALLIEHGFLSLLRDVMEAHTSWPGPGGEGGARIWEPK